MKRKSSATEFIENLDCLIDLHLHLDGSLSVSSARRLAGMQNVPVPHDDSELKKLLTVSDGCRDLNEYLEKFDFPCSLLQTPEALTAAVETLESELKEQGLMYAEIRFAPQKHCDKGMTQETAVRAAVAGMGKSGLVSNLILCCMRGKGNDNENLETLRVAREFYGKGVCAVDLAGAEALFKTEKYADLFSEARRAGLKFTIHAGEADGPQSVWHAIDFGASRIGHGVRSAEDKTLMEELAERGITLELCPTSNLNTSIFTDISEYPIKKLMDAGVSVTVNTDNISVSGTTVKRELALIADTFGLGRENIRKLLINSAVSAFTDPETRLGLIRTINQKI